MKRTDIPKQLQKLLKVVPYVTLATVCPDGNPWNTPVRGYFDDNLNLYWASWPQNQHSQNIAHNPSVFAVVYDSRAKEGAGIGVYMQMTAKLLTQKDDVVWARGIYTTNFGENLQHEPFLGECPRRLYKAVPHKIWRNTDDYVKGNFVDVRRAVGVSV